MWYHLRGCVYWWTAQWNRNQHNDTRWPRKRCHMRLSDHRYIMEPRSICGLPYRYVYTDRDSQVGNPHILQRWPSRIALRCWQDRPIDGATSTQRIISVASSPGDTSSSSQRRAAFSCCSEHQFVVPLGTWVWQRFIANHYPADDGPRNKKCTFPVNTYVARILDCLAA